MKFVTYTDHGQRDVVEFQSPASAVTGTPADEIVLDRYDVMVLLDTPLPALYEILSTLTTRFRPGPGTLRC